MTRIAIFLTGLAGLTGAGLAPGALAHPGHLETVGGHDHWHLLGGLAVLALAAGAAACRAVRAVRAVRAGRRA